MKFAERLSRCRPSATLAVNAKALELKAAGVAVTSLALGEPDFPTPEHIKQAARQALDNNFTRYTAVEGIAELREAVCLYYRREYGVQADPKQVIVGNGGKQCLFNLLFALLDEGDEVLIPAPYWTSYPDMVLLVGGRPVIAPSPSSRGFRITPDDLEKAVTPRCRALILNSPSNPTGVAYTAAELNALADWAASHDIFVVADEMYDQLVYAPAERASLASWWSQHPDRAAVVNGLSKAFAMTGWRVGHTLAHPDLVRQMGKIQGQTTSNICSIAQMAAKEALEASYACIGPMREAFQRRRDKAYAELRSWPGVVCPLPEGAFYLFPDVSALFTAAMPDAAAMSALLLEKAHVAVVPGEAFGDPKCIRLSYAVDEETLMDALARIRKVLYA